MKRLEVKAPARIGGKHSGEAGFLKRVSRCDAGVSGAVGSATCRMPPLLFSSRWNHECRTADTLGTNCIGVTLLDGDQKLDGDDNLPERIRPEILHATKTVATFKSAVVKFKRLVRCGWVHAEWANSRQAVPKYLACTVTPTGQATKKRKRLTTGVKEIFGGHLLDAVSATQSLVALSSVKAPRQ